MRKTTINLIVGILIGLFISALSESVSGPHSSVPSVVPVATTVSIPTNTADVMPELTDEIAPGLQIVEVPPPLDVNGRHPYQCYLNGQPVNIPKEVIEELLAKHTDNSDKDPNFNVHNFTGNLKFVGGRNRGIVGE